MLTYALSKLLTVGFDVLKDMALARGRVLHCSICARLRHSNRILLSTSDQEQLSKNTTYKLQDREYYLVYQINAGSQITTYVVQGLLFNTFVLA